MLFPLSPSASFTGSKFTSSISFAEISKLALARLADLDQLAGYPLLVCVNHPSWWDPLIGLYLSQRFFKARRQYAPIAALGLAKYRFFERLGFFRDRSGQPRGRSQVPSNRGDVAERFEWRALGNTARRFHRRAPAAGHNRAWSRSPGTSAEAFRHATPRARVHFLERAVPRSLCLFRRTNSC